MAYSPSEIEKGSFSATAFSFFQPAEDSEVLASPGGTGYLANAGATLLIGDAVYHSTTGVTVNKSTTQSLYTGTFAGVIVGGVSTIAGPRYIFGDPAVYGVKTAATVGQQVLVQNTGIVLMIAGAAITANTSIMPSGATAGRVITATGSNPVLGRALDAASGNGVVIRVLLAGGGSSGSPSATPRISQVKVTPQQASISSGTQQFTATSIDQFGSTIADTYTWTSTTTAVATVDSAGLVTTVAGGTTAIVATSVTDTDIVGFAILNILLNSSVGTFTPALVCGTSGTITLTSPTNSGTYTRFGNMIHASVLITVTSVSSPVGTLRMTGLPVAVKSGTNHAASIFVTGLETTAITEVQARALSTATQVEIVRFAAGVATDAMATDIKAASTLLITLTYSV